MEINDNQLILNIRSAKNGSQAAFKFLLDHFWNTVYGYQIKRTNNEYEAEDISIQTFSRAFDKIATFDESYSFSTWLITISKNLHVDLLRKKNASIRAKTTSRDNEHVYNIADETPTIEDKLIKEQHLEQLLADIKQLKPHYQEVINLRFFQEQTYKQIANNLDEPINNVKVKLLRAKRLLAEIISQRNSQ